MNIYLWESIGQVSDSYHCGGGLMVVASDEQAAREMILAEPHVEVDEEEWAEVRIYELAFGYSPILITFPDAGCC